MNPNVFGTVMFEVIIVTFFIIMIVGGLMSIINDANDIKERIKHKDD